MAPTHPSAVGKEALDEQAEWYAKHLHSLRMPNVG